MDGLGSYQMILKWIVKNQDGGGGWIEFIWLKM
jgi:hypothetical protein